LICSQDPEDPIAGCSSRFEGNAKEGQGQPLDTIFTEALAVLATASVTGGNDGILCNENGECKTASTKIAKNFVVHWIRRAPRFFPKILLKYNGDIFSIKFKKLCLENKVFAKKNLKNLCFFYYIKNIYEFSA
jgi:hypothetical protein